MDIDGLEDLTIVGLGVYVVHSLGDIMKHRLEWFFLILSIIGGVPITLGFFNIGREFFSKYLYWFLAPLWIGVIGNMILKRYEKKQNKS